MQVPAPVEYERATSVDHAIGPARTPRPGGPAHRRRPQPAADDEAAAGPARGADRHQRPHRPGLHPGRGRRAAHRGDDPPPSSCSTPPSPASTSPSSHDAERVIADPIVRNRGTVGGSLCQADPSEDLSAVFAALRGQGRDPLLLGRAGRRHGRLPPGPLQHRGRTGARSSSRSGSRSGPGRGAPTRRSSAGSATGRSPPPARCSRSTADTHRRGRHRPGRRRRRALPRR